MSPERFEEEGILGLLFAHRHSKAAAEVFLQWLKSEGGRCSTKQMSEFSRALASGTLGPRLSRTNFYGTVLKRFVDFQLVGEQLAYDYSEHGSVKVYRALVQPTGKRRPAGPSFVALAYDIASEWNRMFGWEWTTASKRPG